MKYFRSYPWGMQLLLFMLMIFTMVAFGTFLLFTFLPKFTPYSFVQLSMINEQSPAVLIRTSVIVQGISNVFVFLIPAWLFAYLAHPDPSGYLGLRAPGKGIHFVLTILLILGAMPVLQYMQTLISHIDFGPKVKAEQAVNEDITKAFLHITSFRDFLAAFIVIAIVPAMGEEMFFRGVMLRFTKKRSRSMTVPIVFTAIVFSLVHSNVYGFIPILLAGALLGVIYYLTGSLWCSILAHLFFNGFQVILAYCGSNNAAVKAFMNSDTVPFYYVISGAVVACIAFYLLLKHKTPLPGNWTDDFTEAELSQKAE